jgi:hypothetical protein
MDVALFIFGILLSLVGLAGYVWLLVEAFQDEVAQGVFCLLCGCYALYYAFARLESQHKSIIQILILVGMIGRIILFAVERSMQPAGPP